LRLGAAPFLVEIFDFGVSIDEQGTLNVEVDPTKIKLPGLLRQLNETLESATGGTCRVEQTRDGIAGRFEHTLPPMGSPGSAQFLNLTIGADVILRKPEAGTLTLEVGARLASRERPFAVVYSGLGGVGWFQMRLVFGDLLATLGPPSVEVTLDLGLGVGAAAEINLGKIIKGSAMIALSVDANLTSRGSLTFGAQLLIHGEVSILGLITASVTLLLRATYNDGKLTASGNFRLTISIFMFSIAINETVTFERTFGAARGNLKTLAGLSSDTERLIKEYVGMLDVEY
jgi:hypothetical protein